VSTIVNGGITYYFPFKYKVQSGSQVTEYSMVLRMAEQYLIRAEARARLNKISLAQDDINMLRIRAALPNIIIADQQGLLKSLWHEKQIELFSEWGHRWLDLKRTGEIDSVMKIVCPQKQADWKSFQQLYPLPQTERDNDVNLTQNPGY
jgi:hypothetical protein